MWIPRESIVDRRKLVAGLVGVLSVLAWISLWVWGQSPYGRYLSHHSLEEVRGDVLLAAIFVAGWTLMIVAMMLPTSIPLVTLFAMLTRDRRSRHQLLALLVAGYLAVWGAFGLLVYIADWAIHGAVDQSSWLAANAWAIAASTLILTGLYQFSPLKHLCLEKCRLPLGFITSHWRGRHERRQALWLGAHHGIFCLGCCWSLMLLMFTVGVGNLGWMLVLGIIMAAEKNLPWGRRLSAPVGTTLLCWGLGSVLIAL